MHSTGYAGSIDGRVTAKESGGAGPAWGRPAQRCAAVKRPGASSAEHRTSRRARNLPSLVRLLPNWETLGSERAAEVTPPIGRGKEARARESRPPLARIIHELLICGAAGSRLQGISPGHRESVPGSCRKNILLFRPRENALQPSPRGTGSTFMNNPGQRTTMTPCMYGCTEQA